MRAPVSRITIRAVGRSGAAALLLLLVVPAGAPPVAAASPGMAVKTLQPHRAVYDMDLAKSSESSFSQGFGRIVIEMTDACDGFIVSQRQRIELVRTLPVQPRRPQPAGGALRMRLFLKLVTKRLTCA